MNGVSLRALVISDIHYETEPVFLAEKVYPEHDVVILAGDIDIRMDEVIGWLKRNIHFGDKPVIYVPGNHEYYYHTTQDEDGKARWASRDSRVHLGLGEDVYVIGGVKFICATLWTDFLANGADQKEKAKAAAARDMNDYKLIMIRDDATGKVRRLTPDDTEYLNMQERAWIENHLRDEHDGPVVVVTHHSPGSRDENYDDDDLLNPSFLSESELIQEYQPTMWIHGHQHASFDYQIGDTRVLANPKGYGPHSGGRLPENKEFIPDLVVEIPFPAYGLRM